MPAEGVELSPSSDLLTTPEILRLGRMFVHHGVNKIRLTGGEPTVRRDLLEIIRGLNEMKEPGKGLRTIAMTSNGVVLSVGTKLRDVVAAGLTHLNISLDTLDPYKFEVLTRRPSKMHAAVLSTLDKALGMVVTNTESTGIHSLKLNVVVMKGVNDDEITSFANLTRTSPFCVRFIEFMPFQGNKWSRNAMVKSSELIERLKSTYPGFSSITSVSGDQTSREWKIPGYKGTLGFISSMSDHFCSSCTRLRLTADGQIKVCLFDPHEVSLRDLLRKGASDEEVMVLVEKAVHGKKARHAGMENIARLSEIDGKYGALKNRPMIKIGLTGKPSRVVPVLLSQAPAIPSESEHLRHIGPPLLWSKRIPMGRTHSMQLRLLSTHSLTHLDEAGSPKMVDVSEKEITIRKATAIGTIYINDIAYSLVAEQASEAPKGQLNALEKVRAKAGGSGKNVLTIAQLAGILGTKYTAQLIPLCHTLPLSNVDVSLIPIENDLGKAIRCVATVKAEAKTGVEMEALTAVSVALLTVWDMLKAVAGQDMRIGDIKVVSKEGGKSNFAQKDVDRILP
ncbi:hypothetical protein FRC19_011071 [Serendipita sp. 401]|nr:hypothetical protein FRC19_011071 [Serendipita sp. 401]KAG9057680.1 hypothetical protein FS842_004857 [Serendipita sp. 407]